LPHARVFFLCVSSIAAGGVGGYVASEKDVVPHLPGSSHASRTELSSAPIAAAQPVTLPVAAPVVSAAPVATAPSCDDTIGEPDACPAMPGPTIEGGPACGSAATTRCNDFKQTMKPRVAQAAVACLNKLTAAERCDPKRVALRGHLALMNACDEGATTTVSTACDRLAESCGTSSLAPSPKECRLTMSGLREVGREALIDCAKKHCFDKGVLGCEAVAPAKL